MFDREYPEHDPSILQESEVVAQCPSCGKSLIISVTSIKTTCKFCSSELRITPSAMAEYYAKNSSLPSPLRAPEIQSTKPELANLLNLDTISDQTGDLQLYSLQHAFDDLHISAAGALSLAQREQMRKDAAEKISTGSKRLQKITSEIVLAADSHWVTVTTTNYNNQKIDVPVLPIIHENGKCSLVAIYVEPDLENYVYSLHRQHFPQEEIKKKIEAALVDPQYQSLKIVIRRAVSIPQTKEDITAILEQNPYGKNELFDSSAKIDLDTGLTVNPPTLESRLYNNPYPGYEDLAPQFDQVIQAVRQVLYDKHASVKAAHSANQPLPDTSHLSQSKLELVLATKETVNISCQFCGTPIASFNGSKAYGKCRSCGGYTDVVAEGTISAQHLEADKASDLFMPAEYFLQLLAMQGYSKEVVQRIFEREASPDYSEQLLRQMTLVDVITTIALEHPSLLAHYVYRFNKYSSDFFGRGAVLFIEFPDTATITSPTNKFAHVQVGLPDDLRGKVLCITLGDYGNDAPKTDSEWYRMRTTVFDKNELSQLQSNSEWGAQVVYKEMPTRSNHWLNRIDQTFDSGSQYYSPKKYPSSFTGTLPTEKELFQRTKKIIASVPQELELQF